MVMKRSFCLTLFGIMIILCSGILLADDSNNDLGSVGVSIYNFLF